MFTSGSYYAHTHIADLGALHFFLRQGKRLERGYLASLRLGDQDRRQTSIAPNKVYDVIKLRMLASSLRIALSPSTLISLLKSDQ